MQKKLLIVDDNATNLKLASICFERDGFNVITAQSVESAQDAIADEKPDYILCDVCMPIYDGIYLLRWASDEYKHIPFVLYSAVPELMVYKTGYSGCENFKGFIPKISPILAPLRFRELLNLPIEFEHGRLATS